MFEHSLIDLEEKQHPRRRWAPLPVAVGLHLAVLASVALAQVWTVAAVEEPQVASGPYFVQLAPPPPPAAPSGGQTQTAATPGPTPPVRQPDADRIPDEVRPDPGPQSTGGTVLAGDPHGVAGGVTDGVDGGVLDSTGTGGIGWGGPVAPPEPRNEIVRFDGGSMTRPVLLTGRQPRYTEIARRAGIEGIVILEAVIDKAGHVSNVRIVKPLSLGLDAEAEAAVKEWVFEPARLGGRPMAVYYTLTVSFRIQR